MDKTSKNEPKNEFVSFKNMIDHTLFCAMKAQKEQQEIVKKFSLTPDYTVDLSNLKPEIIANFLGQRTVNVDDLSDDADVVAKIKSICDTIFELQSKYPIDLCLSYGAIKDTPLLLQRCIVSKHRDQYTIVLNSEINMNAKCARLLGVSKAQRAVRTTNLFRASDAISAFNEHLLSQTNSFDANQFRHYPKESKKGGMLNDILQIKDVRLLSIFLNENSLSSEYAIANSQQLSSSERLRQLFDPNQRIITLNQNNLDQEGLLHNQNFLLSPDQNPDEEFGVGFLSGLDRIALNNYDSGKSFSLSSEYALDNSRIIAAFIAQSACKNSKVVHLSSGHINAKNVQDELKKFNVEDLLLDLTSRKEMLRNVYSQIEKDQENCNQNAPTIDTNIEYLLGKSIARLTEIFDATTEVIAPWNVTIADIAINALQNYRSPKLDIILSRDTCLQIFGKLHQISKEINLFSCLDERLKSVIAQTEKSRESSEFEELLNMWRQVKVASESEVVRNTHYLEEVNRHLPEFTSLLTEICEILEITCPNSFDEFSDYHKMFTNIIEIQDIFIRDVFDCDLDPFILGLGSEDLDNEADDNSKTDNTRKKIGFFEKNRLNKEAMAFLRPGVVGTLTIDEIIEHFITVKSIKEKWSEFHSVSSDNDLINRKVSIILPSITSKLLALGDLVTNYLRHLNTLFAFDFMGLPFEALSKQIDELYNSRGAAEVLLEENNSLNALQSLGISEFVMLLSENNYYQHLPNFSAEKAIEYVWHQSVFSHILDAHPEYNLAAHSIRKLISEFVSLDEKHLENLTLPVKIISHNWRNTLLNDFHTLESSDRSSESAEPTTNSVKEDSFRFIRLNNRRVPQFINKFYTAVSVSPDNVGMLARLGYSGTNPIDTLIIDNVSRNDFWSAIACISMAKQVIWVGDSNVTSPLSKALHNIELTNSRLELSVRDRRVNEVLQNKNKHFRGLLGNIPNNKLQIVDDILQSLIDYINEFSGTICVLGQQEEIDIFKQQLRAKVANDTYLRKQFIAYEKDIANKIDILPFTDLKMHYDTVFVLGNDSALEGTANGGKQSEKSSHEATDWTKVLLASKDKLFLASNSAIYADLFADADKSGDISDINADNHSTDRLNITSSLLDKYGVNNDADTSTHSLTNDIYSILASLLEEDGLTVIRNYENDVDLPLAPIVVYDSMANKKQYVIVSLDWTSYQNIKSFRELLHYNEIRVQNSGARWCMLSSFGLITNPKLEIARIKDMLIADQEITKPKATSNDDQLDARGRDMIANKPPHHI